MDRASAAEGSPESAAGTAPGLAWNEGCEGGRQFRLPAKYLEFKIFF